jgi:hypothetical protein
MYYTTEMLPDPNASHFGFYLVLGLVLLFTIALFDNSDREQFFGELKFHAPFSVAILTIVWLLSFAPVPMPLNEPVIAKMTTAFDENYEVRSGKRSSMVTGNFVVYKVPEGEVIYQRSPGQVFPSTAILYKQNAKP